MSLLNTWNGSFRRICIPENDWHPPEDSSTGKSVIMITGAIEYCSSGVWKESQDLQPESTVATVDGTTGLSVSPFRVGSQTFLRRLRSCAGYRPFDTQ